MRNPNMPAANAKGVAHLYIDNAERPDVAAELKRGVEKTGSFNPLYAGKKNVGRNIATEIAAGKPRKQAIAIALSVARRRKSYL